MSFRRRGLVFGIGAVALTLLGTCALLFRMKLKGGQKIQIHGWFQDTSGKDLCGAYYASVKRN